METGSCTGGTLPGFRPTPGAISPITPEAPNRPQVHAPPRAVRAAPVQVSPSQRAARAFPVGFAPGRAPLSCTTAIPGTPDRAAHTGRGRGATLPTSAALS